MFFHLFALNFKSLIIECLLGEGDFIDKINTYFQVNILGNRKYFFFFFFLRKINLKLASYMIMKCNIVASIAFKCLLSQTCRTLRVQISETTFLKCRFINIRGGIRRGLFVLKDIFWDISLSLHLFISY